jgi:hypothetical protein
MSKVAWHLPRPWVQFLALQNKTKGKGPDRNFSKEDIRMAKRYMRKMLVISNHQNHNGASLTSARMAAIKMTKGKKR